MPSTVLAPSTTQVEVRRVTYVYENLVEIRKVESGKWEVTNNGHKPLQACGKRERKSFC